MLLVGGAGAIAGYVVAENTQDETRTVTATSTVATTTSATDVRVPNVVGLNEDEAVVRLADVGLKAEDTFQPTSKPTGKVISQTPAAGASAPKGTAVQLVVDRGEPPSRTVQVPAVTGRRVSDAQEALSAAGLDSVVFVIPSAEPRGQVVSQEPKAGEKARRRSKVRLNVSSGPMTTTTATTTGTGTTAKAVTTTVPDVVGLTRDEATRQLADAGLKPSFVVVPSAEPEGTVAAQAQPPGTTLRRGSRVQINVSDGQG